MPESFDDQDLNRPTAADQAVTDPPADAPREAAPADPAGSADAGAIDALERERDALQDRLLRLAAEFDNYRKRVDRDRRDQAEAAMAAALEDLLPIVDDLDRALETPSGNDMEVYRRGVELIHRQMTDLLRKRGVTPIEAVGADFDPRFHQAVMREVSAEHRDGEVMEELRRGYMLGGRLLRPAMVKVARRE
ncbi:MAG: nucleotide exchange factor GrpE [Acidobacteria bacterium RIFCSPLOWO2_02_FULL_68_18]|nr:MAG: nucleotide exchange factor GrpE [Acidobacteria bacterium RIFCSPLOWO2_02_FULL_68_18]OFW50007.1 MAG: nucleotide exchange factor GrpE [Acidobacteria bacterium RIFCSPLOWO2_12_FULL_68_19]